MPSSVASRHPFGGRRAILLQCEKLEVIGKPQELAGEVGSRVMFLKEKSFRIVYTMYT